MADLKVLNGGQKVTLYGTFYGKGLILAPGLKLEFNSIEMAVNHMKDYGMEATITGDFSRKIHEAKGEN